MRLKLNLLEAKIQTPSNSTQDQKVNILNFTENKTLNFKTKCQNSRKLELKTVNKGRTKTPQCRWQ